MILKPCDWYICTYIDHWNYKAKQTESTLGLIALIDMLKYEFRDIFVVMGICEMGGNLPACLNQSGRILCFSRIPIWENLHRFYQLRVCPCSTDRWAEPADSAFSLPAMARCSWWFPWALGPPGPFPQLQMWIMQIVAKCFTYYLYITIFVWFDFCL